MPRVEDQRIGAIVIDLGDEFTVVADVEPTDEWVLVDATTTRSPNGIAATHVQRGYVPRAYAEVPKEAEARIAAAAKLKNQLTVMMESFSALKREQQHAVAIEEQHKATTERERAERSLKHRGVLVCGVHAYTPSLEEAQFGVLGVSPGQTFRALRGSTAQGWVFVGCEADARVGQGYVPQSYIARVIASPEKRVANEDRRVATRPFAAASARRLDALERSIAAVSAQATQLEEIDPLPPAVEPHSSERIDRPWTLPPGVKKSSSRLDSWMDAIADLDATGGTPPRRLRTIAPAKISRRQSPPWRKY